MKKNLPELPATKRKRYSDSFGLKKEDIEIYLNDPELASWLEKTAEKMERENVKILSNYVVSDYIGLRKSDSSVKLPSPANFAQLVDLVSKKLISSRAAKDILAMMVSKDESPAKIAEEKGMLQKN